MNIFKISYANKDCLVMTCNVKQVEVKKVGPNVFFFKNNLVVGFNIFDFKNLHNIPNGRILVTQKVIVAIENAYGVKLDKSSLGYFVVGKVISCEKIPNTHLSDCIVDINKNNLQIVCGAGNVRQGMYVVVATVGVQMNNGVYILSSKLQNHISNGMLCSQRELGLNSYNDDGIIDLDVGAFVPGEIFLDCYIDYEF